MQGKHHFFNSVLIQLFKMMVEVIVLPFLQMYLRLREAICPLHMYYCTPCYIVSCTMCCQVCLQLLCI